MKRTCLVCGGKYRPSRLPGLLTCEECKFTTANLTLSEEELRQLYTAGYFTGNEYRDYVADRSVIEKQCRLRLRRLLPFVTDARSKLAYILLCLKHQRPNLYATLRNAHLLNWDLYLNLGDIVFVVAERTCSK